MKVKSSVKDGDGRRQPAGNSVVRGSGRGELRREGHDDSTYILYTIHNALRLSSTLRSEKYHVLCHIHCKF